MPADLPLLGAHQRTNARLALAVANGLSEVLPIPLRAVSQGLSRVAWAGRLQVIHHTASRLVLLDGAHNPAGARALVDALKEHFPAAHPTLVLGILADKNWRSMCEILAPCSMKVLPVVVHSERTASPQELAEACVAANPAARIIACLSLVDALRLCENDPCVLIAGSLYLIGEALELLAPPGFPGLSERGLNEWGAVTSVQR